VEHNARIMQATANPMMLRVRGLNVLLLVKSILGEK
jgi:hypothetical protein